jgi:DNA-binding CsgD family transcriptional regulator
MSSPAGHGLTLTDREQAVARLVGQALTNKQIARRLSISPHTVNYHLRQLYRKLGINNRVHLACYIQALAEREVVVSMADPGRIRPGLNQRGRQLPAWPSQPRRETHSGGSRAGQS